MRCCIKGIACFLTIVFVKYDDCHRGGCEKAMYVFSNHREMVILESATNIQLFLNIFLKISIFLKKEHVISFFSSCFTNWSCEITILLIY